MQNQSPPKKRLGFFEFEAYRMAFEMGWIFIIPLILIPTRILLSAARGWPRAFSCAALSFAITGFTFFSIAKFSLFRRGIWFSWGSSAMTNRNRALYRFGYGLIAFSGFIAAALLVVMGLTDGR
jgi:hypothetical protein